MPSLSLITFVVYLHVLASGSNTSIVFKYVVPSKPPTAISCPFTTASPTYEIIKSGLVVKSGLMVRSVTLSLTHFMELWGKWEEEEILIMFATLSYLSK